MIQDVKMILVPGTDFLAKHFFIAVFIDFACVTNLIRIV